MLYGFILNMWIMREYTPEQVQNAVTKQFITQTQANMILATPQVGV